MVIVERLGGFRHLTNGRPPRPLLAGRFPKITRFRSYSTQVLDSEELPKFRLYFLGNVLVHVQEFPHFFRGARGKAEPRVGLIASRGPPAGSSASPFSGKPTSRSSLPRPSTPKPSGASAPRGGLRVSLNLTLLALHIAEKGIRGIEPRFVFSVAEALELRARAVIDAAFEVRTCDILETIELGDIAWECSERRGTICWRMR